MMNDGDDEKFSQASSASASKVPESVQHQPGLVEYAHSLRDRGTGLIVLLTVFMVAAFFAYGVLWFLGPKSPFGNNVLYGHSVHLQRKYYGDNWPYAASDEAYLRCAMVDFGSGTTPRPVVTIEVNGRIYGVNGVAKGRLKLPDDRQLLDRGEFDEPLYKASEGWIERAIENCRTHREVRPWE